MFGLKQLLCCFEFVLRVMFVFFSVKTEPNEFFFNLNNIYAIKLLDIVPGNLVVVEFVWIRGPGAGQIYRDP